MVCHELIDYNAVNEDTSEAAQLPKIGSVKSSGKHHRGSHRECTWCKWSILSESQHDLHKSRELFRRRL